MQQHPIPRQITSFEFKLVGFLTIKQFAYMIVFILTAVIVFYLFPIPVINIALAGVIIFIGVIFSFVPIQNRPVDVWIKNLYKSLTSPTQYIYKKKNKPIYFLDNLIFTNDPHKIQTHIESKKKLENYLGKKKKNNNLSGKKKENISSLFQQTVVPKQEAVVSVSHQKPTTTQTQVQAKTPLKQQPPKPFLVGVVKNNKKLALSGMMVYLKDDKGTILRLMKTNPHGVFATFKQLSNGEYILDIKDPEGKYFFDTMKIKVSDENKQPIEVYSKEVL